MTDKEHEKLKRNGYNQEYSSSYKSGHRRGVCIFISSRVCFEMLRTIKDGEGRYVLVIGRLEGVLVTLFNFYAPPGSDWGFYKNFFDLMTIEREGLLVAGGDLNQRPNPYLDSSGNTFQKNIICKKICK